MSDFLSKALLSGLGLASLTSEALQQMGQDLAKRSKMSEQEGRRLVRDLQKKSKEAQRALEETVESSVHKVIKSLNLVTMDDLHRAAKRDAKAPKKSATRRKPATYGRVGNPKRGAGAKEG